MGHKSRISIIIHEGDLKGIHVYLEYDPQTKTIIIKRLNQVGFKTNLGEMKYFKIDDIPTKEELVKLGYDLQSPGSMMIWSEDPDKYLPMILSVLTSKGFNKIEIQGEGKVHHFNESVSCEVTRTVDDILCRVISKIAFNYLAYWTPVEFVLNNSFDDIRTFIRWGNKPDYQNINISNKEILIEDQPDRRILGHIVTVNWTGDGNSIIAQITLSNSLIYKVLLAKKYNGIRIPITKGNLFALGSQRIFDLKTNDQPVFPGLIIARHNPILILPERYRKEM